MGGLATRLAVALAPLVWLAACGAAPKPTYQLTQSEAAVRAAEEIGADKNPQAALHLKMARDQMHEAKELIIKHAFGRAKHLLRRAEADANLAIALAKQSAAEAEAKEAKEDLQQLREELKQK